MRTCSVAKRLRWYQFGRRSLFVLMLLAIVGTSWCGLRLRASWRQRDAVAKLGNVGIYISYVSPFSVTSANQGDDISIWPRWLRQCLGDDFFLNVAKVMIIDPSITTTELKCLGDLRGLEAVEWSERVRDGQLAELACIPTLRTLDLRFAEELTDDTLQGIEKLDRLETVLLPTCRGKSSSISDRTLTLLGTMKNLRNLSLDGSSVTDSGLKELEHLDKLEQLDLYGTAITDAGLKSLLPMKRLKRLSLARTEVTDEGMATVAQLKSLEELNVVSFDISPEGLRKIVALPALRTIGILAYSCLTPEGFGVLRQMRYLKKIEINCIPGSLEYVDQLPQVDELQIIDIPCTDLSSNYRSQLCYVGKLSHLKSLDLMRTPTVETDLVELAGLKNLKRLVLPVTMPRTGSETARKILSQPGLEVWIGEKQM